MEKPETRPRLTMSYRILVKTTSSPLKFWVKEEMLVTLIFSFPTFFFNHFPHGRQKSSLCDKRLTPPFYSGVEAPISVKSKFNYGNLCLGQLKIMFEAVYCCQKFLYIISHHCVQFSYPCTRTFGVSWNRNYSHYSSK